MDEIKMDRKKRYTRMVLQDSLIELMREKPINKITIKELCENADVNRSTFYAHFSDQFELLSTIEEETLSWAKVAFENLVGSASDEAETIKGLEGICQYIADNSKHLQILMSEQGDISFQKQLFTLVYHLLGINPQANQNGEGDSKELSLIFAVNGCVGLIQHWLKTGLRESPQEIAGIIFKMTAQTIKYLI